MIHRPPIHLHSRVALHEYYALTDRTRAILIFASTYCADEWGYAVTWTSLYREGDSGVHGFNRGADMSKFVITRDGKRICMPKKHISQLEDVVNKVFPYGKGRYKTAIYHKVVGGAYHFHFQSKI